MSLPGTLPRSVARSEPTPALPVRRSPRTLQRVLARSPLHLVILVICAIWILPIIGFVVTAFRSEGAAATTGWWTVFAHPDLTFADVKAAFRAGIGGAALNSLAIAVPSNVVLVSCSAVAAYVLSGMRFVGRRTLRVLVMALLVIPPQVTLEPAFRLMTFLHLVGKIPAVWIFQAGFTLPLGIFLLATFFAEIPREIIEAARVEGASEARIFTRIVLPLGSPGLLSLSILAFIFSWNDYLIPLLFLSSSSSPLTVAVAGIAQQTNADTQAVVAAAAMLSVIPPVAIFYALQRYFVRGLAGGAVKG